VLDKAGYSLGIDRTLNALLAGLFVSYSMYAPGM